jgi:hypothetical protein
LGNSILAEYLLADGAVEQEAEDDGRGEEGEDCSEESSDVEKVHAQSVTLSHRIKDVFAHLIPNIHSHMGMGHNTRKTAKPTATTTSAKIQNVMTNGPSKSQ